MSNYLGLDVSTSNVGIVLLDESNLLYASNLSLSKIENQYKKATAFEEIINHVISKFNVDKIFIEEPLQRFSRGLSSANTISTLARFNGIVSYITFKSAGVDPALISVNLARKAVGVKIPRKDPNSKDIVLQWVKLQPEFTDYHWPTKELKSGPRRGQIITDSTCFDIADAAVMAYYGRMQN